jgi:glycosyltransferase involved in cell wall biosynthesis
MAAAAEEVPAQALPAPAVGVHVGLIYKRMGYFGEHSGWPAVVPHLAALVDCRRLTAPSLIHRVPHRTLDRAVRPRGVPWYNVEALCWELAGARLLRSGGNAICHFLYGEGAYHYLGRLPERSRRRSGRLVCSFHQPPRTFEQHIGPGTRLDALDAVIVQASNQLEHLADRVAERRLFLVPHGVDTRFFVPRPSTEAPAARLLCVGSWLRDFATLRQVALRAQHERPELRFTVVGRRGEAAELAGLHNVELVSNISDRELLSCYHSAAALLLPLRDTTANNGLLEAMACGLPVVGTRVGGIGDYVDGRGAILVSAGDATGMWQAAVTLVEDPARAATMGAHNRARVLQFDWQRIAEAMVEIYIRLYEASSPGDFA